MGDNHNVPAFLGRKQRPAVPPLPESDKVVPPEVARFLTVVQETGARKMELERQLEEAYIENDKLNGRLQWLAQELKRAAVARDQYQAGYCEQKAQMAILIATAQANYTTAQTNYDGFIALANSAMRSIHDRMVALGVDTNPVVMKKPVEMETEAEIESARTMAEKFAPRQQNGHAEPHAG